MAALQMRRQFWQFFYASYDFLQSFSLFFLSMWYQSNLKFNNGTLPVSKLNAIRPVTLTHNSVTDKHFTAIWNRSLFHIVLSFFLICFSWIELLRLIRLFDWFVLLSSHLLYYLFSPLQFFCVSTQMICSFIFGTTQFIEILLFREVSLARF